MNRGKHDVHLGLACIAGMLEANGHDVSTVNGDYIVAPLIGEQAQPESLFHHDTAQYIEHQNPSSPIWDRLAEILLKEEPDVIGVTSWSGAYQSTVNVCKAVKAGRPDVVVVVGGVHATLAPRDFVRIPEVDYVISGEGEHAAKQLWDVIGTGGNEHRRAAAIKGVWTRLDGELHEGGRTDLIQDLDSLPPPSYRSIIGGASDDFIPGIVTARGCPYRCGFCASEALWTCRVRYRSVDRCIQELVDYDHMYGLRNFRINDDSFCLKKARVLEFCEKLESTFGRMRVRFWADANVGTVDEEILRALERAGCCTLSIGVESVAPRVREAFVRKPIDLDQVRWLVRRLNESRISSGVYFLTGWPGETEEELRMNIDFMQEIKPRFCEWGIVTPYPGTPLYEYARENGILPNIDSFYLMHHSLKTSMAGIPYARHVELLREIDAVSRKLRKERIGLLTFRPSVWRRRLRNPLKSALNLASRALELCARSRNT